mmetsp:Transcript_29927/g.62545  ORF Transcript_29927/g.62545 Transcript_29927/m.62545 type:complete len:137 (-) Transcript_29927:195-605(-)
MELKPFSPPLCMHNWVCLYLVTQQNQKCFLPSTSLPSQMINSFKCKSSLLFFLLTIKLNEMPTPLHIPLHSPKPIVFRIRDFKPELPGNSSDKDKNFSMVTLPSLRIGSLKAWRYDSGSSSNKRIFARAGSGLLMS